KHNFPELIPSLPNVWLKVISDDINELTLNGVRTFDDFEFVATGAAEYVERRIERDAFGGNTNIAALQGSDLIHANNVPRPQAIVAGGRYAGRSNYSHR